MKVPLLDLKAQYQTIKEEIKSRLDEVFESQWFVLGPNVEALEKEISTYCGAKYGIGVASGSDALLLSLMALNISYGDVVITTPYTFFSTVGSIVRLGASPLFVDIDPKTYNIDLNQLEDKLKKIRKDGQKISVKAVIPVHLYGQCVDMEALNKIAVEFELKVVEDAAQAIGAEFKGNRACSSSDLGCLSFFPSKNLGGFGDGGMILTNDKELEERLKILRVHGSKQKYYYKLVGLNSRLDELQAVVLRVKLKHLNEWIEMREKNANVYKKCFQEKGLSDRVGLPYTDKDVRHVYNQFVVRVPRRDEMRMFLTEKGIGTEIYYPVPLHLQECFKSLGYKKGD
ncbi:MAG: DegT/DnrJ/EryC1/StrS family aminotransferase, partial [Thermodesulfobacteriota bacterium]